MSVAEELREWANENAEYHYSLAHDRGTCMHRDTADTFTDILEHGWPERIQAELDKKDAIIQSALDALPVGNIHEHTPESIAGRIEHFVSECVSLEFELDKKDAEIAALKAALRENNIEPCERCGSQEHRGDLYGGQDTGLCDSCAHDMGAAL